MNKNNYSVNKINSFIPDIPINEESRDNLFSLATSHKIEELEEFITTNSISLNVKNNNNQTIIHVLLDTENTTDEKELLRCIKFLVNRGAYISSSDNFLLTPLFICIKKNYLNIFNYLLDNGANLNINTYDNLTVMHVLAQSGYNTYDANGIQSIIPEKLPKITMEKYKIVYEKIQDALQKLNVDISILDTIAKQFYYHNEKEEDFNNLLLIEEYKKNLNNEQKNDLFEKIQNTLQSFYDNTKEIDENNLEYDLNNKLTDITIDLNNNIRNIEVYNDDVLKAIKNLALSLELSIHYFFLQDPINTNIATDVVIEIAEKLVNGALPNPAFIRNRLNNDNNVRPSVNAVQYSATAQNTTQQIIKIIKKNCINQAAILNGGTPQLIRNMLTPLPVPPEIAANIAQVNSFNAIKIAASDAADPTHNIAGVPIGIDPPIIQLVRGALNIQVPAVPPLAPITIEMKIRSAANNANDVVLYISRLENDIKEAIRTLILNPIPLEYKLQVFTILQAASRASVYVAVYIANKGLHILNISPVYGAFDLSVITAVNIAITENSLNQEILQRELTNSIVAVEVAVRATKEAIDAFNNSFNAYNINVIYQRPEFMIEAIEKALENIDVNKESIKTIIEIAKKAATINNITIALTNINLIREAVVAVEAAVKAEGKNINYIREIVTDAVINILNGAGAGTIIREIQAINTNIVAINIRDEIIKALTMLGSIEVQRFILFVDAALILPIAPPAPPAVPAVPALTIQNKMQLAATNTINAVIEIKEIKKKIEEAINILFTHIVIPTDKLQILSVLQAASRSVVYAAVYANNKILILPLENISAIYTIVDTEVISSFYAGTLTFLPKIAANQEELQIKLQNELKDHSVAIESVVIAVKEVVIILNNMIGITSEIMIEAIKKALRLPIILPEQFKNIDYNKLIKKYKLINIPQKYINNDISYKYSEDYIEIKSPNIINKYKLPEGDRSFCIDYFNLLYTFIKYTNDNNIQIDDINDKNIFILYRHIQQIYKYNYIIYIFNKEKEKILKLKDNFITELNTGLKEIINKLFESNYYELVKSIEKIKKQLDIIKNLANDYIDNYNKLNGYKIYKNPNANNIGIYPKIQFPTEINHKLSDENAIISKCEVNYITYNKYKNDFFHHFVLYFQDIGLYVIPVVLAVPVNYLLNGIQKSINYNIDINNCLTDDENEKNKTYKLYFYDSLYLKLTKQNLINRILNYNEIKTIRTKNKDIYKVDLSIELDEEIKKTILNEILENNFDIFLKNAISNLLKEEVSKNNTKIQFTNNIKELDINSLLLKSLGFRHILIPNYEFINNKFLSVSKNRFLKCILYFDTKYFKSTNINILNYYKNNNSFIEKLLINNSNLLLKTDVKGWTPIYYAIDSNNYNVIEQIIKNKNTLMYYDNKNISPLQLCINKQLHHLNYLLDDDDNNDIHYLNNYIKMLRTELKSNKILIPLNIDAVFIIALFIQNDIWRIDKKKIDLEKLTVKNTKNTKRIQINREYNNAKDKVEKSDVNNNNFKFNDTDVKKNNKRHINYENNENKEYDDNIDQNIIFTKYNIKAKELERQDFGLYGSYWINYKKYKYNLTILEHITNSKKIKEILNKLKSIETKNNNFNAPKYDNKIEITKNIKEIEEINKIFEHYLKFINIRFNSNKDNAYTIFLNKIYVHVLANIIGVDFYLTMEELIVKYYLDKGAIIDNPANPANVDNIKNNLLILNKLLINNKLNKENINYLYITEPTPELVLKNEIKDILLKIIPNDNNELINTFETVVLPRYRDLYKITYKYLKMFMENYHKFIYNQYHGLEILLLLLSKL
jgi:hypothetical protein